MPEIAEVALMADTIKEVSLGRKITEISILGGRYLKRPLENLAELQAQLPLRVSAVKTKGKRCWLELSGLGDLNELSGLGRESIQWWILISFGMSGAIYYEPTETEIESARIRLGKPNLTRADYMKFYHIHVKIDTDPVATKPDEPQESGFYFGDMRQFGSWKLFKNRADLDKILNSLGPDMLTGPVISDSEFIAIFRGPRFRSKNICKVLMSQEAVSGVGNYIKSEVLYRCRINPRALISDLNDQNLIELHQAIRGVALSAYQGSGASLYTFTGSRQEKGDFQNLLQVYGRERDPLGHLVVRLKTADQRMTHWVPEIQTVGNLDLDLDLDGAGEAKKLVLLKKPVIKRSV